MSRIDELIQEFCPEGVGSKLLGEVCTIKTGQPVSKVLISKNPGEYPVINSGREPLGFIDKFNTEDDPIGITSRGAGVGSVTWCPGKYYRGNLNYSVTIKDKRLLDVRFLYFLLMQNQPDIQRLATYQGIPALNKSNLEKLQIPIPPLEVQKEIVNILDKFTQLEAELSAELSAELDARREQYEYYREELMTFGNDVQHKLLGEVGEVTKLAGYEFTAHIKYANEGKIIALRGLNVKHGRLDLSSVKYIDQSNFAKLTRSKLYVNDMLFTYVGTIGQVALIDEDDKYYLAPNVARIRFTDKEINPVFMRYYFQTQKFTKKQINRYLSESSMKNLTMENIRKFQVPLPTLDEQDRIVELLDKFNALVGDISIGIPAELSARRQQYEYYRNKLLTFQELTA